jgi:hypothetical protein
MPRHSASEFRVLSPDRPEVPDPQLLDEIALTPYEM